MTFTQINYFLELSRTLNYTHAAANMFVTQSTLSRSIAALENEIGVQLFERDYHTVKLTKAGEVMYAEMASNMERINRTLEKVQEIANRPDEKIRVGILEGQEVDVTFLFAIKDLAEQHPNLAISIQKSDFYDLISGLKAGKLDVVSTALEPGTEQDEEFDYHLIRPLRQYFVAPEDDSVWQEKLCAEAIAQRTLIMPSKYYPGNQKIIDALKRYRETPSIIHAEDIETHRVFLETGMGATIINSSSVIYTTAHENQLRAEKLEGTNLASKLDLVMLWKKRNATGFLETFIEQVKVAQEKLKKNPNPKER